MRNDDDDDDDIDDDDDDDDPDDDDEKVLPWMMISINQRIMYMFLVRSILAREILYYQIVKTNVIVKLPS